MALQTEIIARTGQGFSSFGPYVAAINDAGHVAFSADGAVFVWRGGGEPEPIEVGGEVASHPDIDASGRACAYVRLESGETAVALDGKILASGGLGPLGPTMNDRGQVACRARGGLFIASARGVREVAAAGDRFIDFYGLPCAGSAGDVVFRADRGIYRWHDGEIEALVEIGGAFVELAHFPALGPDGSVIFAARTRSGRGVWQIDDAGELRELVSGGFESFRGALASERGFVFFATPPGGALGIYDDSRHRLFGIDDDITGFALNPVSINRSGQLALRLDLASGAGAIARLEP